jgi:Tol biopolymer transport system component/TolA-binding protein
MKKYKNFLFYLFATIVILSLTGRISSSQQAASQLFEKALYAEEIKGDLAEAVKIYQQVLKENPGNRQESARALLHIGICYEKLGSEQARQAYQDVIGKYSDQAKEVSMAKERINRLEAFTAELNREAEKHMKNGNELFKRWEYESAVKEYENAIKLGPNTQLALNARYCIGQSWFRAGKYDAALATFTKLIEENPQNNIAPVTELMVTQVKYALENKKSESMIQNYSGENTIIDPKTGIKYTKIKTFTGKNDLISYTSGGFNLSPDNRFMVLENKVVPVDGSDAFKLADMEAGRAIYAPGMKKAAFYADSAIWTIAVSPETGRAIGQPEKLLAGRYRFQCPVSWSPDGEKLAFERVDKSISGDIWTINVSTMELMPVINSPEFEACPVWSPDGKSIAYISTGKERNLSLTSVDGKETKMIVKSGGYPYWSGDSKWLFHTDWENNHLYSLDRDKNFKLTPPKQVGSFASFSYNGAKMLFYRPSYEGKWGLKVVSTSGGPSFTPESIGAAYGSQWSTDSKHILVQSENEQGEVCFKIISLTGENLMKVNIEAQVNGKPFPFTASPDLTKIAFSVTREDRKKDLYIIPFSMTEARTTGPARLVFEGWSGGAYNVLISWSADGNKLAVVNQGDIWVYTLNDGKLIKITDTPEPERWINFSPDGNMISYYIPTTESAILHIIPATGGMSRVVNNDCKGARWSPDSKSIALVSNNELQVVSLDGQKIKHIANIKDLGLTQIGNPLFSPDGKNLAMIGYFGDHLGDNDKNLIILYNMETAKITRLAQENLDDNKDALEWSPDGEWLSYTTEESAKVRPEGTLWEADFNEIKEKLAKE